MDAYEATKVVFSRIQALDPDNAANIMGTLLIQDHGEKEMIRLAFGPEALLQSVVLKARKDLGLLPPLSAPSGFPCRHNSTPSTPLVFTGPPSPASSSWPAPKPVFSGTNSGVNRDQLPCCGTSCLSYDLGELKSSGEHSFGDTTQELRDFSSSSPNANVEGTMLFPYGGGGGTGTSWPQYRRSSSPLADDMYYLGTEATWRPCLYYARGFCKNGSSCRFQHACLPDDHPIDHIKADEELFLRPPISPQLVSPTQLVSSAAHFPYGAASVLFPTSTGRSINFLLQQQHQGESQRAAAAAAAATLMLGADAAVEGSKFIVGRSPRVVDREDYAGNPGSRQIYLTFPADSTFREEDVSNYFSIYGPVQDVRIPYQQKRMFGFVTFVYPETVKIILAKGNPHFVCDARVLVKPYKEKGKIPDKKHQYQQQLDRADFSVCPTPVGLDARDAYDLRQLGPRMLFNASPQALLRRKLEEEQQAAELQQAIDLQGRRFMGLQVLDLKNRSPPPLTGTTNITQANQSTSSATSTLTTTVVVTAADPEEPVAPEDKSSCPSVTGGADQLQAAVDSAACGPVSAAADKEEAGAAAAKRSPNKDSDFRESAEPNLPDNPFASAAELHSWSDETADLRCASHLTPSSPSFFPQSPAVDVGSRNSSCFLELSR